MASLYAFYGSHNMVVKVVEVGFKKEAGGICRPVSACYDPSHETAVYNMCHER